MTILDELFVNSIADNSANLHCTGIQRYLLLVNGDVRAILGPERYDIAFWLGLDSDDYENNDLNPSTTTSKLASNDSHTLNTSLESGSEESIDALRQEYEMLEHILIMDSLLRHFFEYWPEHPDPEELNTNVLMASVGPDRFEGHEVDVRPGQPRIHCGIGCHCERWFNLGIGYALQDYRGEGSE